MPPMNSVGIVANDGKWLLCGFGEYSDVVLLIRCFEEGVDLAK